MTEERAVLHVALRAPADAKISVDGKNVIPEVHEVLNNVEKFVARVRCNTLTTSLIIGKLMTYNNLTSWRT